MIFSILFRLYNFSTNLSSSIYVKKYYAYNKKIYLHETHNKNFINIIIPILKDI